MSILNPDVLMIQAALSKAIGQREYNASIDSIKERGHMLATSLGLIVYLEVYVFSI